MGTLTNVLCVTIFESIFIPHLHMCLLPWGQPKTYEEWKEQAIMLDYDLKKFNKAKANRQTLVPKASTYILINSSWEDNIPCHSW